MGSSKILTGLLIGAAVGAVAGILFAPEKGIDTRKLLGKKGLDLKGTVKNKINELVDGIADQFDNARNEAENLVENGKEKMSSAKSQIKQSYS